MILIITRKLGIEGYAAFFKFLHFIMLKFNLYLFTRFSNEDSQRSPIYYDMLIGILYIMQYYKCINSWNSFENQKI